MNGRFQTVAGIFSKTHGWHDKAVTHADKRSGTPLFFTAGDHVQHLQRLLKMSRFYPAATDVFASTADRGVAGVEIHVGRIG